MGSEQDGELPSAGHYKNFCPKEWDQTDSSCMKQSSQISVAQAEGGVLTEEKQG